MIQPCLPPCVVQDVNVAHLHQLPSLFPGGFALFIYAVYDDLGALVGQHLLCVVNDSYGRLIAPGRWLIS